MELSVTILLSGGIDSTACIHFYLSKGYAVEGLIINYGQHAFKKEHVAAIAVCEHFSIPLKSVRLHNDKTFLDGNIFGRNAFFICTAFLVVGSELRFLCIGIHGGTNYIDCSPLFLEKMNEIAELYNGGETKIVAPFLRFNKREIFEYCIRNFIPLNLTYSCELGLEQPCGKCSSCKEINGLYAS